jgi:hypothetical protein
MAARSMRVILLFGSGGTGAGFGEGIDVGAGFGVFVELCFPSKQSFT